MARAADEGAEPAELHREFALLAERALARVFDRITVSVLARKDIGAKRLVEGVKHSRDAQLLGAVNI